MSQQSCSKSQADRVRLASYLTVGVAGAMMTTAHSEAAVVNIDLTNVAGQNIAGVNGGLASGTSLSIADWLGAGTGRLDIYNATGGAFGLDGDNGLYFAITGGNSSPRNFGAGATIDGSAIFTGNEYYTVFKSPSATAPDFGANSFMGFRFGSGSSWNYGYLEVTWTSATNTFQILSGAYESTVNTSILAGATAPAAVPGAGLSAMALMTLGGGAFRRRSRDRVA